MLVYQATKREFMDDVTTTSSLTASPRPSRSAFTGSAAEVLSWQNSMQYMYKVLDTPSIPGDCGVAIEFGVPYTSSRIDFLLTGHAEHGRPGRLMRP